MLLDCWLVGYVDEVSDSTSVETLYGLSIKELEITEALGSELSIRHDVDGNTYML